MHGILLIDKPQGMTSHDVVREVRKICKTRKVGHAGTLDPLATGVLVVAVGDGTKILRFLFTDNKSYRATLKLGETTDTLDSDGQLQDRKELPADCQELLEPVCAQLRGKIMQTPPIFSALKRNGVPLYKLARNGETVEIEPRPVSIHRLEILSVELPEVTIEVDCSTGTYIRSLVRDIGAALGCGAHLNQLRRLKSGRFHVDACCSLDQLKAEGPVDRLLSLDQALADLASVPVEDEAIAGLCHGIPPERDQVKLDNGVKEGDLVRLSTCDGLVAVACYAPQRDKEKRGDFKLVRVFCPPKSLYSDR